MASDACRKPSSTTCVLCGRPVAHDHEGDRLCGPCLRSRAQYNPFHDATFARRLLEVLMANPKKPVRVYRELGIERCGVVAWRCVQVHIRRFRRQGHRIVGAHDGTYTWLRHVPRRNGRAHGRRGRSR